MMLLINGKSYIRLSSNFLEASKEALIQAVLSIKNDKTISDENKKINEYILLQLAQQFSKINAEVITPEEGEQLDNLFEGNVINENQESST